MSNAEQFVCPNCGAKYRIVRTEGPSVSDREVTCLSCGAPFPAREGKFVLKYFRIDRPKRVSGLDCLSLDASFTHWRPSVS